MFPVWNLDNRRLVVHRMLFTVFGNCGPDIKQRQKLLHMFLKRDKTKTLLGIYPGHDQKGYKGSYVSFLLLLLIENIMYSLLKWPGNRRITVICKNENFASKSVWLKDISSYIACEIIYFILKGKKGRLWYVLAWLSAICSRYSNKIKGICPSPVAMKQRGERCLTLCTFMNGREIQSIIFYRLSHWIHFCWWFMAHSFLFCVFFRGVYHEGRRGRGNYRGISCLQHPGHHRHLWHLLWTGTDTVFRPEAKRRTTLAFWPKRGQNRNSFKIKANRYF